LFLIISQQEKYNGVCVQGINKLARETVVK
jgi:hypothetical protein